MDGSCQEFVEKCVVGQVPLAACTVTPATTPPFGSGRGQQITFSGTGFGSSMLGSIELPNADDDGISTVVVMASNDYFDLWSDTLIVMDLSSIVDPTYNVSTTDLLGSGIWTIVPGSSNLPCQTGVEIDYNLTATKVSHEFKTFSLAQADLVNPSYTRNWYIIDSIDYDSVLKSLGITHEKVEDVAKAVFCDWERATGIDFVYKGVIDKVDLGDDKYTISFSSSIGSGTLMQTSIYPLVDVCDSTHLYFGGRIIDGDFEVNSDVVWFFNPNDTSGLGASNGYDFYSVLLHEVGHSLGLEHSMDGILNGINDPSLMYYSDPKGFMRRTIDGNSSDGVKWLIDKTKLSVSTLNECFSSGYGISTSIAGTPCYPTAIGSEAKKISCSPLVTTLLTKGDDIVFKSYNTNLRTVTIVDALGRVVLRKKLEFGRVISTAQFTEGLYFLFTNCGSVSSSYKILIL